jgi:hypothetical protein
VRRDYAEQAARRTAKNGGALTAEDALLEALLSGSASAIADAARIRAEAALLDHDYLAYWVDALGLSEKWREVERGAGGRFGPA